MRCFALRVMTALCLVCLVAHAAFAEEGASLTALHSGVEFGYAYANVRYREPGLMKETGSLHGVQLRGTYHCSAGWMGRGEMEYLGGGLDYDGQTQAGAPRESDTEDSLFQLRALVGYDIDRGDWALTPFIGIGYRYWFDDIEGSGGYEREIRQLYSPVGAELAFVRGKWRFGLCGEYDIFWGGRVKSRLSQAVSGLDDARNDQDMFDGYGLRGAVFVAYTFDGFGVVVEPYIRYWDIDESDSDEVSLGGAPYSTVVEPENTTRVYGVAVRVSF
ncbi:hypothetical protein GGQ74_001671 [Desulfobaculum xiamenense]|uniref:Autotransporter domain-containing protein n=1 Tax=Desulfobaculum xiamenense TaxID=995050 RepID=A0A846QIE0_9BACT|nr:outer membrane beta-barrel protein [Desulfobaculum xiamenense]NJB67998.1 hypothetical protein [Desulfobaculum xiamenense]